MLKDIVQKAAVAVVAAVMGPAAEPERPRDPWYRDDERKAEVNAASTSGLQRWVSRRRGRWIR